jgi:hypothetical protein
MLKWVGRVFVLKGQVISAQWQRLGKMETIPIFFALKGQVKGLKRVGNVERV